MIRPRIRPTVSRRNKYLSIAPRAEKKLSREGRRASHDLRRLVGHANFLDVLDHTLDEEDVDEAVNPTGSLSDDGRSSNQPTEPADEGLSEDDSTASEEEWSDDSDDDDHTLVRTASGTPLVDLSRATRGESGTHIFASGDDYFSDTRHAEAMVSFDNGAAVGESIKDAGITVSEMTSPLSDLMEELGYGMSPREPPKKDAGIAGSVAAESAAVAR